jgi:hypothetical protein
VIYLTLTCGDGQPKTLIRLDWPGTQEYVSADFPLWRKNPDLARLEWDSTGNSCSPQKAEKLMADWGVEP